MKIYAPSYYKEFKCIADKCKNSCCIGWEIDVDKISLGKYQSLTSEYGRIIAQSISSQGYTHHFIQDEEKRCPHLDATGLCRIITELGEDYLCDICREHPRFYNNTPGGREAGLGMSCDEACRIILSSDGYDEFIELGECEGEAEPFLINPLPTREEVFRILKSLDSYEEKLAKISERFKVSLSINTKRKWRRIIKELEYLDPTHRELFSCFSADIPTPINLEKQLERMLAYLVYRHVSVEESVEGMRCALGFALFCERLLCSVMMKNKTMKLEDAARIISAELEYSEENTDSIMMEFLF